MKTTFVADALEPIDSYKLLTGLVVPRPIAWVASVDEAGVRNLAPFSFFNVVAPWPPTVMFSTVRPKDHVKDTLANVRSTGEFTVSIVGESVLEPMNASSASLPPDVDEFDACGMSPHPSDVVSVPFVAEAPAALECTVVETIDIGEAPMAGTIVLGRVVRFHVDEDLLDGTRVDPVSLAPLGKLGGPFYTPLREVIDIERPS